MKIIGDQIGYAILRFIAPRDRYSSNNTTEKHKKADTRLELENLFGTDFFDFIKNKVVIDFGCGMGNQSIEMAKNGALRVIGIDIQEHLLENGRRIAEELKLDKRCVFRKTTDELADVIISKDAFEHFYAPAAILKLMSTLLKPEGCVLAAFGPTWLHPYGGHRFSVFPWSHLIFTESAQIKWRADFKTDGATKFAEIAGGLNQLTVSKFEQIVAYSPFSIEWMETVPIKGVALFKSRLFREIGSSIIRCKLKLR